MSPESPARRSTRTRTAPGVGGGGNSGGQGFTPAPSRRLPSCDSGAWFKPDGYHQASQLQMELEAEASQPTKHVRFLPSNQKGMFAPLETNQHEGLPRED